LRKRKNMLISQKEGVESGRRSRKEGKQPPPRIHERLPDDEVREQGWREPEY